MKKPVTLSSRFVETVKQPGRYGDGRGGHGLILNVNQAGNGRITRSWIQRIRIDGKPTHVGIGSFPVVSLAMAREQAVLNLRAVRQGKHPNEIGASIPTFEQAAETVIGIHAEGWKNAKSAGQWRASLRDYAYPLLADMTVDKIETSHVMDVLLPHWQSKHETMRRVRQRIGAVMKWSVAQGYRTDNPMDSLTAALPKAGKVRGHHKALPYAEVPAALETIAASGATETAKLAFRFSVLTACRSGEVRGATWNEIDGATWEIPGQRMKTGRPHRVPLSDAALAVLEQAREYADKSGLIFPSPTGRQLSDSTLSKLLRENGIACVPHGMRSSFRVWASERTSFPREVCELALAHVNKDRIEAAYQRSDLYDLRRRLMAAWASYLAVEKASVSKIA